MRVVGAIVAGLWGGLLLAGCGRPAEAPAPVTSTSSAPAAPRHLLLVTVDTLRADHVGAYGSERARTPVIDGLAAAGVRMDAAFATAPVTLTSHASILSGLYPPAHGARHNGVALPEGVPTLATVLKGAGFATGAFVGAFPLDRRFGLARGFDVYGDRWPRGADGRPADERPGQSVVDEALAWRATTGDARTFLWVHLFEPHAPYGDASRGRPAVDRYDDEIAEADRQIGRLLAGLGAAREATLVVVTADHGEAFGEHGEIGHSLFVYDTTLRVPLVLQGPGTASAGRGRFTDPVSLVDIAPTVLGALGVEAPAMDGQRITLDPGLRPAGTPPRTIYAETFAPYEDFGWSPLRAIRAGGLKYIQAPTPELYDLAADASESTNLATARQADAARLRALVGERAKATAPAPAAITPEARRRLQALGYLAGSGPATGAVLADPKERRALAARIAEVTSGEVRGPALEAALRRILADDPGNPQASLRLGYVLAAADRCREALPLFRAAIARHMPTADAHLGLAGCLAASRAIPAALAALKDGAAIDPGNPVVLANLGALTSDGGDPAGALSWLRRALAIDPDLHQARFTLAVALARTGDRAGATAEAATLLQRLPAGAPQRSEVERLLAAVR